MIQSVSPWNEILARLLCIGKLQEFQKKTLSVFCMLTTPEMQVAIINNRDNKLSKDSKHHQINQRIID